MATIGSILVELRANTAKFEADMEKARKGVKNAGGEFDIAKRKAENFAEEGLGKIIPMNNRVADSIIDMVGETKKGAAALQLFAKGFIIVTGAMAVAAVVQQIQHWRQYGQTIAQAEENLKKLTETQEEERKALDRRQRTATAMLSVERELALARSSATIAARQAASDDIGAAHAEMQGRLEDIETERKAREASIFRDIAMGAQRTQALANNESIALQNRLAANASYDVAVRKIHDDQFTAQAKRWTDETKFLIEQLKERVKKRQELEAQIGKDAPAGSTTAGFGALRAAQQRSEKRARDIALLQDRGDLSSSGAMDAGLEAREEAIQSFQEIVAQFGRIPAVMAAAQRWIDSIQFGNFQVQIEKGRQSLVQMEVTNSQLKDSVDDLSGRFRNIPAAVDVAAPAIRKLNDEYVDLAWAIYDATQQLQQFNNVAAAAE